MSSIHMTAVQMTFALKYVSGNCFLYLFEVCGVKDVEQVRLYIMDSFLRVKTALAGGSLGAMSDHQVRMYSELKELFTNPGVIDLFNTSLIFPQVEEVSSNYAAQNVPLRQVEEADLVVSQQALLADNSRAVAAEYKAIATRVEEHLRDISMNLSDFFYAHEDNQAKINIIKMVHQEYLNTPADQAIDFILDTEDLVKDFLTTFNARQTRPADNTVFKKFLGVIFTCMWDSVLAGRLQQVKPADVESSVKKGTLPPLMKKFINIIKSKMPEADITVLDGNVFRDTHINTLWDGFKMGQKYQMRFEPAWGFIGRVTEEGIQIAEKPQGYWKTASFEQAVKRCEKVHGGKFIRFSISHSAYLVLKAMYANNPNVVFKGDDLFKVPFFTAKVVTVQRPAKIESVVKSDELIPSKVDE